MKKELNKNELKLTNGGVVLKASSAFYYLDSIKDKVKADTYYQAKACLNAFAPNQSIVLPILVIGAPVAGAITAMELNDRIESMEPAELARYLVKCKAAN